MFQESRDHILPISVWIGRSIRASIFQWRMGLGAFLGGLSLFSLLNRSGYIDVSIPAGILLEGYRTFFLGLFDALTWPFDFSLHPILKEAITLWLLLGGIFVRVFLAIYDAERAKAGEDDGIVDLHGDFIVIGRLASHQMPEKRWRVILSVVFAIIAWPILLIESWVTGAYWYSTYSHVTFTEPDMTEKRRTRRFVSSIKPDFLFDTRIMYLAQITAMFVVCALLIALNIAASS